jgi:uncharacterized protein YecA (UPF0149 family)
VLITEFVVRLYTVDLKDFSMDFVQAWCVGEKKLIKRNEIKWVVRGPRYKELSVSKINDLLAD